VIRINGYLGHAVLREMDQLRVPVGRIVHPPQVASYDVSEYSLVVTDHDQLAGGLSFRRSIGVPGVVVQDLRAVGVQAPTGQRVLSAELMVQGVNRRADPLHRNARLPEGSQGVSLRETNEWHRSLVAAGGPTGGNHRAPRDDTSARPLPLAAVGLGRER
jgi:hypothetical protein